MTVRIIKNWDYPDILRQTPNNLGQWKGIHFTLEENDETDFVIVLNYLTEDVHVKCSKENIWVIMQEPYIIGSFDWMVEDHQCYSKVFTHYISKKSSKYISSNPMLPWHVNKSYDELKGIYENDMKKEKTISWITSTKSYFPGHKKRMSFLKYLRDSDIEIDIFGRGIKEIGDKWDGLAPYKYALAIENSSSENYWTEKLADCFLSYTMPIYYGCTNIDEYFPEGSIVKIDINKPSEALNIIKNTIRNKHWEKNIEAIKESRKLILEKYNFFNQIYERCNEVENVNVEKDNIFLLKYKFKIKNKVKKLILKIQGIIFSWRKLWK